MRPNPLPAANSRPLLRLGQFVEVRCSLASSELGSPAAADVSRTSQFGYRWRAPRHRSALP